MHKRLCSYVRSGILLGNISCFAIKLGNLYGMKVEMLEFQNQFMINNPYSFDIETNWWRFKLALNIDIKNNILLSNLKDLEIP